MPIYLKSDPIPETNSGIVKIIVGNNFEEMVLNSNKFVLFEAYAPWCTNSKKLEPVYLKIAEDLKSFKELIFTKMDATKNEHPSLNIDGFPIIKLYKPS